MVDYNKQIKELQDELRKTKYNKATQGHIGIVKAKIAQLKQKQESRVSKKTGRSEHGYSVRKSGDGTVLLLGFPSAGKSTLLNKLTDAKSEVAAYSFTTLSVVPGVMEYKQAKIQILAYTKQIHKIEAKIDQDKLSPALIESNIVRCPNESAAKKMIRLIEKNKKQGDSVGGIIECVIKNVPTGLGSPVFDKLDARLAQAMLSIPAVKGFEIGSGFECVLMKGSDHNDSIEKQGKKIITTTNHAGGIVGGISNGMDIVFRVAFKPTATIFKKQQTITKDGKNTELKMTGRHDPCVIPRAVPIVEAMAALVLVDEWMKQKAINN